MRLVVKRILSLHEKSGLSEAELFNQLIDLAARDGVDCVMADLPPGCLTRFRDWLDDLPSLDTLMDLKAGPISEREKSTIRAIRDWLDCRPDGRESPEEAGSAANGSGGTDPSLPIGSRH
jgi:hypothetical protein